MAKPERTVTDRLRLLLPAPVRKLPADLAAVVVLSGLACLVVLVPGLNETLLRVVFGLPLVLFLPGYVLVAALFPEAGESPEASDTGTDAETGSDAESTDDRGIDGVERTALSFGLSIAVVPLLGLILNFTPWGIRLVPILVSVVGFTVVTTGIAAERRRTLPEDERFRVPYHEWVAAGRAELLEPTSRWDAILNVALVCSVLLALATVGFAVAVPPQGETFTEFYLLSEDEDGELVAANYPSNFTLGDSRPVVVGIGNHEGEPVEYTVVVQLQDVTVEGNETTVEQRQELDRFSSPSIADNETWQTTHDIEPTMTGDQLRLQYLLYRGSPPASPTAENAYRDLHLWVDVDAT